ncbi:TBA [Symbiodinium necroappetens]|uniref:TBA protein n=1 Tax=Symbiodinium necroappetens TaxID=1628268 RepID=A0A812IWY3_9DINO|nr:TBA [Symbiodinium necroappetens]
MGFAMETETDALLSEHIAAAMMPMFVEHGLISLKALRLCLEQRTGLDLSGCRAHIRYLAERVMETITSSMVVGCGLGRLSAGKLAELRNPYVGVWEPCLTRANCEVGRASFSFQCDSDVLAPVPAQTLAGDGSFSIYWVTTATSARSPGAVRAAYRSTMLAGSPFAWNTASNLTPVDSCLRTMRSVVGMS